MKAALCTKYGSPDVLKLGEIDKPTPKDNQVCIKIHASAVTGSDVRVRALRFPFLLRTILRLVMGITKPRNPVLGMVLAGEYLSVDDGMLNSEIGTLELLNTLLHDKKFTAVIDKIYPLEEIVEAHRYVDQGHKKGNVVITI